MIGENDAREWHVTQAGKARGPYTLAELTALVSAGSLDASALGWRKDMTGWVPLTAILPTAVVPGRHVPRGPRSADPLALLAEAVQSMPTQRGGALAQRAREGVTCPKCQCRGGNASVLEKKNAAPAGAVGLWARGPGGQLASLRSIFQARGKRSPGPGGCRCHGS